MSFIYEGNQKQKSQNYRDRCRKTSDKIQYPVVITALRDWWWAKHI